MNRITRIQLWALAITFVALMLLTMTTWALDGWLLVPAGAIGGLYLFIVLHPPSPVKLVLMVDRSGSLYTDDLNDKAIKVAESFLYWARHELVDVHVIQFDHKIISVTILTHGSGSVEWVPPVGGTNFQLPLDYAASIKGARQVLITDGYAPIVDGSLKDTDVIWLPTEYVPVGPLRKGRSLIRVTDRPDMDARNIIEGWSR